MIARGAEDRSQKTEVRKGIGISEFQVAGHQGNRDFGDCPRTKFKKQNWCGICAHSELEKLWREGEAIQRVKSRRKRKSTGHL